MTPDIPTEALEAARGIANKASDAHQINIGGGAHNWNGAYCTCGWESGLGKMTQLQAMDEGWRHTLGEIITAAAPHLIAEGRRQAAKEIIEAVEEQNVFAGHEVALMIAAEGTDHG